MKGLIIIFLTGLIIACQSTDCSDGIQNGNETGIDCGGDCVPCSNNTGNNDISGTWHHNYMIVRYTNNVVGGGYIQYAQIDTSSNCLVEVTPSSTQGVGFFVANGNLYGCYYPSVNNYLVNGNSISQGGTIEKLSYDSLRIRVPSNDSTWHYLNATDFTYGNTADVNWSVNLSSPISMSGQVEIKLFVNGVQNTTIPLIPGQTQYSGIEAVDLTHSSPSINIWLSQQSGASSSETIQFTTSLNWNNIKVKSGPHIVCASGNCSGEDNIQPYSASMYSYFVWR